MLCNDLFQSTHYIKVLSHFLLIQQQEKGYFGQTDVLSVLISKTNLSSKRRKLFSIFFFSYLGPLYGHI